MWVKTLIYFCKYEVFRIYVLHGMVPEALSSTQCNSGCGPDFHIVFESLTVHAYRQIDVQVRGVLGAELFVTGHFNRGDRRKTGGRRRAHTRAQNQKQHRSCGQRSLRAVRGHRRTHHGQHPGNAVDCRHDTVKS